MTPEDAFLERALTELLNWEGIYLYLYLDVKGLVTTGVGHLLRTEADIAPLPFYVLLPVEPPRLPSSRLATEQEKRAAWRMVSHSQPAMRPYRYERLTSLRLERKDALSMALTRLRLEFLPALQRLYPAFHSFPEPAKLALIDLVYNCGADGLANFRNLKVAVNAKSWIKAAASCHRAPPTRETRNDWTRDKFLEAGQQQR